jgi:8-oxo-dGTP diphosphatase
MLHALALRVFGVLPRRVRTGIIRTLYPTFTAGVAACVTDPRGRILLVTHSYADGWGVPGGLMNRGEAPAATLMRELVEELGLELELDEPGLGVKTPGRPHFNILFRAEIDQPTADSLRSHSPEITGVGFHDLEALPELAEFTDYFLELTGLLSTER